MSLFDGTPITAVTSSQSTSQTPKWLQDAIYGQIQNVQNVASLPFQAYSGQTTAGPTANQSAAYNQAGANGGSWQPFTQNALSGLSGLAGKPGGAAAANPYLSAATSGGGLSAAQGYLNQASGGDGGLGAAKPYLQNASQSALGGIDSYMNPYNSKVTDEIARLGARNLNEVLLPGVSDSFVQAGQFGGSRMGEFGARALRDTQDSILGQQAGILQSGYNSALGASQNDLGRQLQVGQSMGEFSNNAQRNMIDIAQAAGQLGTAQQNANLQAAQTAGSLQNADNNNAQNIYQGLLSGGQQLQNQGINQRNELASLGGQQRDIQQQGLQSMYDQYLRSQQYPQQQSNYLTSQLGALSPLAPSVSRQTGVAPTGVNPSTASQVVGGLAGLAGMFSGR